jgi:hypothetical protein
MNFRKARASADNGGCVEVARNGDKVVVRDSKDPNGPTLTFTAYEWACFLDGAGKQEFDFSVLS